MSSITVKLQIPLDKSLRDAVEKHAHDLGFSSVQDFTRVMYSAVVRDDLRFTLTNNKDRLSPAAAARYEKAVADLPRQIKTGEAKTYNNVDDFLADLKNL